MSADIKDYFLAATMAKAEFMKVHYKHIPDNIQIKYKLTTKVLTDDYVYIQIKKGIDDLNETAIISYNHLKICFAPYGYTPVQGVLDLRL